MEVELKIHEELRSAMDELDPQEYAELKKSIEAEGVRDAIVTWNGFIVDGHNRYKIAKEVGKKFTIARHDFKDIDAVKKWIYRNQLGRRNLTPERRAYFIGQLYMSEKRENGGTDYADRKNSKGKSTAELVAEKAGTSPSTVVRASDFAKGVDAVAEVAGPEVKKEILAGKAEIPKKVIEQVGKLASKEPEVVKEAKRDGSLQALLDKIKDPTPARVSSSAPVYDVVLTRPLFEVESHIEKPSLAKDATVYMHVDDAFLPNALKTLKQWGLEYQGTWVFKNKDREDGVFNYIEHSFLICATQGCPEGPKDSDMTGSMFGPYDPAKLQKMLETYHPSSKRLDTRKFDRFKDWK